MLFLSTNSWSDVPAGSDPVENAPRKLLRKEVVHPREPDKLGKCTSQTKSVRQPRGLAADSESALEETLTEDELTSKPFARRHIGVVFNPGAPDRVELSLEDLGLDAFEQLWVELLEPLVLLSARHGKHKTVKIP